MLINGDLLKRLVSLGKAKFGVYPLFFPGGLSWVFVFEFDPTKGLDSFGDCNVGM